MVCLLLSCGRNPVSNEGEGNNVAPVTKVSLDTVKPLHHIYPQAATRKTKVSVGKEKIESINTSFHQFLFPIRW